MMKSLTIAAFVVLAIQSAPAPSALPFYEPFPTAYGDGTLIGTGATASTWDIGNTGSSLGALVTNSAALSYSGLAASNSFGLLIYGTPASTRNKGATFTPQTLTNSNPAIYASFLLNVQQAPTNSRLFAALSSSASGTSPAGVIGLWLDPASRLLISKNSSSVPSATNSTPLAVGTHLVVLRYQWNAVSGADEVGLWLNPGSLGVAEGSVPAPHVITASGADVSPIQSFWILHPTTASVAATLQLDEIRVGQTWASVTPPSGPPAPTPMPVITEAMLSSQGMILRGTNGPASGVYQVLATTNVTLTPSNWPSIAAHSFDPSGNFDSTNSVSPGLAQQYFRLLVGGTLPPPPTAPTITNQPQSLTNAQGQTAEFSVLAGGTAPLTYFWRFNTNTVVGGNSSLLTLSNIQPANAGSYFVIVSNSAGTVTSAPATLTVTVPTAPSITNQPQSQTVTVGQNASFSVGSSGTSPLLYQWYFNTNTLLSGATNAALLLTNVQTSNAGNYWVIVTNSQGAATSTVATLTVNTNITTPPSTNMIGYATMNGGTTGGAGGATVTVSNAADLVLYAGNNTVPYIIQVQGTINIEAVSNLRVRNNKTIVGLGTNATLIGDLKVFGNNNVIIRNLNFTNPNGAGDKDGLTLQDCVNVWVDHCTFYDGDDGNLDISHGADWITVSWCRFYYTNPAAEHRFSNLVGHSDNNGGEDAGKLRVTFHNNWWGQYVHERMPRVRFGQVHSFNNYFNSPGNNYCIRAALDSEVRLENNYFLDVKNPWEVYVTTGTTGKVYAVNNITNGTTFSVGTDTSTILVPGTDTVFVPPYLYTLESAAGVPGVVTNFAGAGKGPFAP